MSKLTKVILLLVVVLSVAYAEYYRTVYVRTLLHVYGKAVVVDSLTSHGKLTLNSRLDVSGTLFARVDSFTTTGATDTLSWTGASVGDLVFVNEYVPHYSTTPDTGSGHYTAEIPGAGGSVIVKRAKLNASSTLKSGAQYFVIVINK